jgi:hypothetical protein
MYHGKGVARGLALGLATGSALDVDDLLHPPLINEGAAAVSLPVPINTFRRSQYTDADGKEEGIVVSTDEGNQRRLRHCRRLPCAYFSSA